MPGSTFGQAFRVTTAGESHGPANVVIIDGCPPGLPLSENDRISLATELGDPTLTALGLVLRSWAIVPFDPAAALAAGNH